MTSRKTSRVLPVQVSGSSDPRTRRAWLLGSSAIAAGTLRRLTVAAGVAAGVSLGGGDASAADYAAGGGVIDIELHEAIAQIGHHLRIHCIERVGPIKRDGTDAVGVDGNGECGEV